MTETVADAGVLLDDKDPLIVACAVDGLLSDESARRAIVKSGKERAAGFALPSTSKHFLGTLTAWLDGRAPSPGLHPH